MLILRRRKNESLLIGDNIRITIIECAADGVRLAIDAPKQVSILREELSEVEQTNKTALTPSVGSVMLLQSILKNRATQTSNDLSASDHSTVLSDHAEERSVIVSDHMDEPPQL
ncbi:carbon storage regulator [bacterium 1XD42-94]|nr:carbon storage regulator [bacterium 1XD42-76]NBK03965.1 carbon storage regulator [bacterium 1XD42-94]